MTAGVLNDFMKTDMRKRGFTLIEFIIIILVISILAAMGALRFVDFKSDADRATEEATVNIVNVGLNTYYVESVMLERTPLYPLTLDGSAAGVKASSDNPFFTNVLESPGVTYGAWYKVSDLSYQGPSGTTYVYDPLEGTFRVGP